MEGAPARSAEAALLLVAHLPLLWKETGAKVFAQIAVNFLYSFGRSPRLRQLPFSRRLFTSLALCCAFTPIAPSNSVLISARIWSLILPSPRGSAARNASLFSRGS